MLRLKQSLQVSHGTNLVELANRLEQACSMPQLARTKLVHLSIAEQTIIAKFERIRAKGIFAKADLTLKIRAESDIQVTGNVRIPFVNLLIALYFPIASVVLLVIFREIQFILILLLIGTAISFALLILMVLNLHNLRKEIKLKLQELEAS